MNWNGTTKALAPMTPVVPAARSRPASETIASAKSICIEGDGSATVQAEISKKLLSWGKLVVMANRADADLILRIEQTGKLNMMTGEGHQASAFLIGSGTGVQLWTGTKGGSFSMSGYSAGWVGRQLGDAFIQYYESVLKISPPTLRQTQPDRKVTETGRPRVEPKKQF